MYRCWVAGAILCVTLAGDGTTGPAAGLITTGIDTVDGQTLLGFDFLSELACTTIMYEPPYDCSNHFRFAYDFFAEYEVIVDWAGRGVRMGKMNLDSVRAAPSDSMFEADGHYVHVDSIQHDSLDAAIGNTYVIKSGEDPRRGYPVYAKFRIIEFNVIDSANHIADMVFVWVANRSGYTDLDMMGVDTFNLDPVPVARASRRATPARSAAAARAILVPGFGLRVVRGGVGPRGGEVFDLRGRNVRSRRGDPLR